MVDLFFLKTFVSVAKSGSFRTAAERNCITQPAVSQHVRILEKKLGSPLLERQGRKVFLTPSGKIFLGYAENILSQYEEAKMRVGETINQFSGTIRIATIYSIGLHRLQPTVKRFLHRYPKIDVHLEYAHNNRIYEMVLNRTVDFGLVAFPKETIGIHSRTFTEERLILVQSVHHPVLEKKRIRLSDLHQKKFIAFAANTPTGKVIDHFLRARKIFPQVIHEYDNIDTLKSAVELGMGCAIVPKNTVTREIQNRSLEMISATGLNLKRPLGILYSKGKVFTKSTRTFHEMITKKTGAATIF